MARYAAYARRPREFQNTSYVESEIATRDELERRLETLAVNRPLRLVYCGRLVARKGVSESIAAIESARCRGARIQLEIIGAGPEEGRLRSQVDKAQLAREVTFAGAIPYGPALLRRLATHDAMLFTPTAEDTPRMIFDGYAAGLPLVGAGIEYVEERARSEHATVLLPRWNSQAVAARLTELDRDRHVLVPLARAALAAARDHAADVWYRRRAEWTHDAVTTHHRELTSAQSARSEQWVTPDAATDASLSAARLTQGL